MTVNALRLLLVQSAVGALVARRSTTSVEKPAGYRLAALAPVGAMSLAIGGARIILVLVAVDERSVDTDQLQCTQYFVIWNRENDRLLVEGGRLGMYIGGSTTSSADSMFTCVRKPGNDTYEATLV